MNRLQFALRNIVLVLGLYGGHAQAFELRQEQFLSHPIVTLKQMGDCVSGQCVRLYEYLFGFPAVLPSESVEPPHALHVSSALSVPTSGEVAFSPFALCCELTGRYSATLSTATLTGMAPEVRLAIAQRGPAGGSFVADMRGPGTVMFSATAGVAYYATVYGAGVTGLAYELSVVAADESRLYRTLQRIGASNVTPILAAVPEPSISIQMLLGLSIAVIAWQRRLPHRRAKAPKERATRSDRV